MRSHEYTGYQINMCVRGFHSAPIVIDKLMVVGSRCGPIDVALDLLEKNSTDASENDGNPPLRMEKYITQTFPLSQAREALGLLH